MDELCNTHLALDGAELRGMMEESDDHRLCRLEKEQSERLLVTQGGENDIHDISELQANEISTRTNSRERMETLSVTPPFAIDLDDVPLAKIPPPQREIRTSTRKRRASTRGDA
jgi:hypothetical protein